MQEYFGEARSLFQRATHDEITFQALCELVEKAWKESAPQTEREFLPFLAQSLRSWPDATRRCPAHWQMNYMKRKPDYEAFTPLQLIRSFHPIHEWTTRRISALASSEVASWFTCLQLNHWARRNALATQREIYCDDHFPSLHTLVDTHHLNIYKRMKLAGNPNTSDPPQDWAVLPRLMHIELSHHVFKNPEPLTHLFSHLKSLEALRLTSCLLTSESLRAILFAEALTQLREVRLMNCYIQDGKLDLMLNEDGYCILRHAGLYDMVQGLSTAWMAANVRELKLEHCHLQEEPCERAFEDYLEGTQRLRKLHLAQTQLSPRIAEAIVGYGEREGLDLSLKKVKYQHDAKAILKRHFAV